MEVSRSGKWVLLEVAQGRKELEVRGTCSDVMFDTEASKLVSKKQNISHWSAISELDSFCQKHVIYDVWSFIRPENHVTASESGSNEANHSTVSFTLYYTIMRLHCFIFILIYILRLNELFPWNNSLRTETELTSTDHRFNSWVYVWFIWIILVAVHREKLMTLTMATIFIQ